jgi:hypothetical protein
MNQRQPAPTRQQPELPQRVVLALETAADGNAPADKVLEAAATLVSWGLLDRADAVLRRFDASHPLARQARLVARSSNYLRRSNIIEELGAVGPDGITRNAILNGIHDALVFRRRGATRLVVVLPGGGNDFFVSLNVLFAFLKKLGTHIVFLRDNEHLLYLSGVPSLGQPYCRTLASLKQLLRRLGNPDTYLLASSAGGFAGIRYAVDLGARRYLGISAATDLSPASRLPRINYYRRPELKEKIPEHLVDMRPVIAAARTEFTFIYAGKNKPDRAHALHLAGLPNVRLREVAGSEKHDVVASLMAMGIFEELLRDLVAPASGSDNRGQRS